MSHPRVGLMEQRISCVNLGVEDVNRARAFYEAMGWRQSPVSREIMPLFNANGTVFILFDRQGMAHEAFRGVGAPTEPKPTFSGIVLSYIVREEEEVQQILDRAEAHGARIISPATKQQWGNLSGYFADPEGHVWEVSKTARTQLQSDGSFRIGE